MPVSAIIVDNTEEAGMSRRIVVIGTVIALASVGVLPRNGVAQTLVWTAPSAWKAETPSSSMRRGQYRIDGPGGQAECVVFYFGPGQGGDAAANVARWAGQFRGVDAGAVKRREIKVGDVSVVTVEIVGTYVGGMGGAAAGPERPDSMLLGAIVPGGDANWFFRAVGPRATLEGQRAAFERMIRSVKRGG